MWGHHVGPGQGGTERPGFEASEAGGCGGIMWGQGREGRGGRVLKRVRRVEGRDVGTSCGAGQGQGSEGRGRWASMCVGGGRAGVRSVVTCGSTVRGVTGSLAGGCSSGRRWL